MSRTNAIEFEDGAVQVDARLIAEGLGMPPDLLLEHMRAGRVTSVCERGADADSGRHRLTFFSDSRRFRLVVDDSGTILQRSAIDFGDGPLSGKASRARSAKASAS